jgi:hypothetical protein
MISPAFPKGIGNAMMDSDIMPNNHSVCQKHFLFHPIMATIKHIGIRQVFENFTPWKITTRLHPATLFPHPL